MSRQEVEAVFGYKLLELETKTYLALKDPVSNLTSYHFFPYDVEYDEERKLWVKLNEGEIFDFLAESLLSDLTRPRKH